MALAVGNRGLLPQGYVNSHIQKQFSTCPVEIRSSNGHKKEYGDWSKVRSTLDTLQYACWVDVRSSRLGGDC